MKNNRLFLVLGMALGLTRVAHATCTGGGDPCNAPRNGTITAHTATTISLRVQNSATPNTTSSIYFFEATTAGAPQNSGTPDRSTVIVFTADFTNPALATDLIAQTDKPLLASASYNTYSKACPPGSTQPTDAGCSAWVAIGAQATDALTNAGFDNIAAADTLPLQFVARTNTNVVDQINVIAWLATQLASTEVGNCSFSSSVQPFPGSGATSMTITSGDCNTLLPNRPYTLTEHLVYDPTQSAPNFVTSTFYTQAKDPVAIDPAVSVTHCSASLTFQNAAANPANPQDTTYSVNVGGPVSAGSATQTKLIGGTGIFSDQNSVTYTNLQAGTAYSPSVTALNRGGGSWRNSNPDSYAGFSTIAWGGTFTVPGAGIGTTSADFVAAGVNTTGVQSWQIETTPAVVGLPSGNAANLNGTHTMTGLNPNTQYTVQIRITEAGGCFSVLPVTPLAFTTTPTVPAAFNLTAAAPRQLSATWAANGNPGTTVYQIQYCTDAAFTVGCVTAPNTAAGATNATISTGILPETTYFAHVRALTVGGGSNSAFSTADSDTTPNEVPTVNPVTTTLHVTSATLSATASDNGGPTHLVYHWVVTASPGGSSFAFTANDTTGASATTQLTFDTLGTYSGTLTVTDHDNVGASKLATTVAWSTSGAGQVAAKIAITPNPAPPIVTGNSQSFNAIVCDQFETGTCSGSSTHQISGQAVNWSLSVATAATLSPANPVASVNVNGIAPGVYTLTAALGSATAGTVSVTILAAGPVVNSLSFVMSPTNKGGVLTVTGHDNVVNSVTSNWTSDPSVTFFPTSLTSADNVPATTAVTFTQAGSFSLTGAFGSGVSSSTVVVVPQILSSLRVCATGDTNCSNNITVKTLQNQQFTVTGLDQFDKPMALGTVVWTSDGGNINGSGGSANFSATTLGQSIRVTATDPNTGKAGSINVVAISFDVSNAYAYPVPYKANFATGIIHFKNLGSSSKLRIFTTNGRKVFERDIVGDTWDWDIKNSSSENVASGVYFYKIESPEGKKDGKLIIIQ